MCGMHRWPSLYVVARKANTHAVSFQQKHNSSAVLLGSAAGCCECEDSCAGPSATASRAAALKGVRTCTFCTSPYCAACATAATASPSACCSCGSVMRFTTMTCRGAAANTDSRHRQQRSAQHSDTRTPRRMLAAPRSTMSAPLLCKAVPFQLLLLLHARRSFKHLLHCTSGRTSEGCAGVRS
jgi:hypothetical protein